MKDFNRIARKITATLFAAQSFGSAGTIAGGTIAAIAGAQLSGNSALAGLPAAVQFAGTAIAAFLVGSLMERVGRRRGMISGILVGAIGALLAVLAITIGSFVAFLGGLAFFGAALATLQQGRFAAAEVHPPESRGRAISYVVLGGTVGSVFGPLLIGPSGQIALRTGADELVGPYVLAAIVLSMAAIVILSWLRPDPRDVGREIAQIHPTESDRIDTIRPIQKILSTRRAVGAITSMVVGQGVMVLVMGMTGLHMRGHEHALSSISVVMSAHTFGMFAFSIITGRLTDRWGRIPVILSGAGILALGCIGAILSSEIAPLALALFGVGVGWNFCFVGGSALLSDELSPKERSRVQGVNDLLVHASTAGVSVGSGVLFAGVGYSGIGIIGAIISSALLFFVMLWTSAGQRVVRMAQSGK